MKNLKWLAPSLLIVFAALGCGGGDDGPTDLGQDMSPDLGGDMPTGCPAVAARTPVTVDADITANQTWTCQNLYTLDGTVYVRNAVLTIEEGVEVHGGDADALVITTTGRIEAVGTADDPIVFTSGLTAPNREPGNWGGLVLLGTAPINAAVDEMGTTGGATTENIEGLDPAAGFGLYGGGASPNPAHDCGTLRYVRIEFVGFIFGANNELNGLTMGGCGSATDVEYVHVHLGLDDGVEMFGGSANLKHIVVSQVQDDGLDWDEGWQGNVQFLVVQNYGSSNNGFEADNLAQEPGSTPRSNPTIFNATIVGADAASTGDNGMILRDGTAGTIRNSIVTNFPGNCVNVGGTDSDTLATAGTLSVDFSLFNSCATTVAGTSVPYAMWANNLTGMDPMLGNATSLTAPSFIPALASPAATAGATPPAGGFFDMAATYRGAFAPGATGTANWMAGWTAFPQN